MSYGPGLISTQVRMLQVVNDWSRKNWNRPINRPIFSQKMGQIGTHNWQFLKSTIIKDISVKLFSYQVMTTRVEIHCIKNSWKNGQFSLFLLCFSRSVDCRLLIGRLIGFARTLVTSNALTSMNLKSWAPHLLGLLALCAWSLYQAPLKRLR